MRMYKETAETAVAGCKLSLLTACGHVRASDGEATDAVDRAMASFARVRRAVYRHEWYSPAKWAVALDELADFNERDIEALVASN
jgi:hypothetical protein